MRRALCLTPALALLLAAAPAAATVTEPNGLSVPVNQQNGEIRLDAYFASTGDPVNWQADAYTTPNAFSPLCGFSATFVLNQAGSHFGLAWYNETGQKPQASDLHTLLAANSPVGATFNGTSIKSDPAYLGGLVGFALIGGETHYTNPAYNTVCTACNPAAPWVTALIYASKNTPNAYYIGFEDGGTSASGWNNDGDFNDDVFFLTGLTCSGGGQPCDTGAPGICSAGLTQCTQNGVTCVQLSQPTAESCNGQDDDCNGAVDEGDLCASGFVCDKGTCVQACQGEFGCPPNKTCSSSGLCVDPTCKDVTCEAGKVCQGGTCKAPCDDVTCPYPQVCRVGVCADACAGVTCDPSQVCEGGICVTRCDCQPCGAGTACDSGSGQCVDPACVGVACGAGTHCAGGTCVDNCAGATCPAGQTCTAGACVDAPETSSSSSSGIFGTGGAGSSSSSGSASSSSGGGKGGSGGAGGDGGGGGAGSTGSCGCRTAGEPGAGWAAWAALSLLGLAAARRRRAPSASSASSPSNRG